MAKRPPKSTTDTIPGAQTTEPPPSETRSNDAPQSESAKAPPETDDGRRPHRVVGALIENGVFHKQGSVIQLTPKRAAQIGPRFVVEA